MGPARRSDVRVLCITVRMRPVVSLTVDDGERFSCGVTPPRRNREHNAIKRAGGFFSQCKRLL